MDASANLGIVATMRDEATPKLLNLQGVLGGLGSAVTAPIRSIGSLAGALESVGQKVYFGKAAIEGAFQFAKGLVSSNIEMENTAARLDAFYKDSGKTAQALAWIRAEADKTPFAFGEMAQAWASLLPVSRSSGIAMDKLFQKAEIMAALRPDQGFTGAVYAIRAAMGGDWVSLIERFDLPRATINKLRKEGVPAMEILNRVLLEQGADYSLVAKMGETFEGRLSTLMDTLAGLQRVLMQDFFGGMKDDMVGIQGWLDANKGSLEALAKTIGGVLSTALKGAGAVFNLFWTSGSRVLGVLTQIAGVVRTRLQPVFAGVAAVFETFSTGKQAKGALTFLNDLLKQLGFNPGGAMAVLRFIIDTGNAVNGLIQIVSGGKISNSQFVDWLQKMPGWFWPVATAANAVVSVFRDIATAVMDLVSGKTDIGGFLTGIGTTLKNNGSVIWSALTGVFRDIDWPGVWKTVSDAAGKVFSWTVNVGTAVFDWVVGIFKGIQWDKVGAAISGTASAIWNGLFAPAKGSSPNPSDVLSGAAGGGLATQFVNWVQSMFPTEEQWKAIWATVSATAQAAFTWTVNVAETISTWIGSQVGQIQWDKVWAGIQNVAGIAKGFWDQIMAALFAPGTPAKARMGGAKLDDALTPLAEGMTGEGFITGLLAKFNDWLYVTARQLDNNPDLIPGAKLMGEALGKSLVGGLDAMGGEWDPKKVLEKAPESTFAILIRVGANLGASFVEGIVGYFEKPETQKRVADAFLKLLGQIAIRIPLIGPIIGAALVGLFENNAEGPQPWTKNGVTEPAAGDYKPIDIPGYTWDAAKGQYVKQDMGYTYGANLPAGGGIVVNFQQTVTADVSPENASAWESAVIQVIRSALQPYLPSGATVATSAAGGPQAW